MDQNRGITNTENRVERFAARGHARRRTLESRFVEEKPKRLIEDRAYDSDPLDAELGYQSIEMITPHRGRRTKLK